MNKTQNYDRNGTIIKFTGKEQKDTGDMNAYISRRLYCYSDM